MGEGEERQENRERTRWCHRLLRIRWEIARCSFSVQTKLNFVPVQTLLDPTGDNMSPADLRLQSRVHGRRRRLDVCKLVSLS